MSRRLFLCLAIALAIKAFVLAAFHDHPLLQPVGDMDSGVYARLAADVARGDVLLRGPGPVPFFVSPLYIYFLAAVHVLSGGSLLAAKVVQLVLGAVAVGLVWAMTRRLFDDRAALIAGILYALTGIVSFHEILILQAALDPFLTALSLFLLTVALTPRRSKISLYVNEGKAAARADRSSWWAAWGAAGAAFGLLALNRPNALLCVPAIAFATLAAPLLVPPERLPSPSKENLPPNLWFVGAFLAGTAAIAALPLARNLIVSGEPVLISSHGGLNFLVGNGPGASGAYRALPEITPDIGGQAADTKRIAEKEEGRPLSTRAVSAHFARKAWAWIAAEPGAALALFAKKIQFVLSGDEAPLNFSYPWYREKSPILGVLRVGSGLLVPLAGAGFVLAFFASAGASRRALLVFTAFLPAYVVAVAVFFVATRYRLPLLVGLAPLAGAAVARLPEALRAKGLRIPLAAAVAAGLAAVSLRPTGLWDGAADEEMHLLLWEIEKGDAGTMQHAEAAARAHPDPALVWRRAGQSFEGAGKSDEAITALSKAHEIEPDAPRDAALLSGLLEKRGLTRALAGDASGARPDLEEAVRLDGRNAAACLNLAAVLAAAGETSRARSLARQALDLKPDYEKARALLEALERMK